MSRVADAAGQEGAGGSRREQEGAGGGRCQVHKAPENVEIM